MKLKSVYGKELILDLGFCDPSMFTRRHISKFLALLCREIEMKPADRYWWDYGGNKKQRDSAPEHLAGVSVVQFIETSNITIHTLDKLGKVFINIFSCKDFNIKRASEFCSSFFRGKVLKMVRVNRI